MLVYLEVSLDLDRENMVEDVVLTVGHDNLSHGDNNVHYGSIVFTQPNEPAQWFDVSKVGETWLNTRASTYYALVQDEIAGFAVAVHSIPREPFRLEAIMRTCENRRIYTGWIARYHFPGNHCGGTLVTGEQKVVTVGGLYDRRPNMSGSCGSR